MTLATNLVKIQTHMSQLEASFAALQAGHQEACDERQALQAAWREEVERQAAAAAAAADALAQREAEWQGREERLQQLR
jgi:peptidoglycan hydrolase CwlO-like protein